MITYYTKYLPGNFYFNNISMTISELVSYGLSTILAHYFGDRIIFILSFVLATIFALPLIFLNYDSNIYLIATCIILTKFGQSSAFNLVYLITADYFPIAYSSIVFGACNVTARIINVFSPILAEVKAPIPMEIYFAFNIVSLFASIMLKKKKESPTK